MSSSLTSANFQPTLAHRASLRRLADILRFAAALGDNDPSRSCRGKGASRTGVPKDGDFLVAISEFFNLLEQRRVKYLLVGGVALLRYVPGRNTEDIDLLLAVEALEAIPELEIEERSDWFAKGNFRGLRIDLLFTSNPLFRAVQEHYSTVQEFIEKVVPCATAEGLILLKLYALPSLYRQGDLQKANLYEADVAALLLAARPAIEPLINELSKHVSASDLAELQKIISEAQSRERRFDGPS